MAPGQDLERSIRPLSPRDYVVTETLTLRLSGGLTAPARARAALGSLDPNLAELRDEVHLLVSELVTNSIVHAGADQVELRATSGTGGVHIEVSDPGPGFDPLDRREPSRTGEGGYGLFLVDKVANRWGIERNHRARVWFEIDRTQNREQRAEGARRARSQAIGAEANRRFRANAHG
jgi:anti-sigma regulatory factor (Ser/Thr protein kinase)